MKGFKKRISKDVLKEVEKVSAMLDQDIETKLREWVDVTEKRSRGTLRKNIDLTQIRR
jgi:hypothetical protein